MLLLKRQRFGNIIKILKTVRQYGCVDNIKTVQSTAKISVGVSVMVGEQNI